MQTQIHCRRGHFQIRHLNALWHQCPSYESWHLLPLLLPKKPSDWAHVSGRAGRIYTARLRHQRTRAAGKSCKRRTLLPCVELCKIIRSRHARAHTYGKSHYSFQLIYARWSKCQPQHATLLWWQSEPNGAKWRLQRSKSEHNQFLEMILFFLPPGGFGWKLSPFSALMLKVILDRKVLIVTLGYAIISAHSLFGLFILFCYHFILTRRNELIIIIIMSIEIIVFSLWSLFKNIYIFFNFIYWEPVFLSLCRGKDNMHNTNSKSIILYQFVTQFF